MLGITKRSRNSAGLTSAEYLDSIQLKRIKLQASTTSVTPRTIVLPDNSGTIALLSDVAGSVVNMATTNTVQTFSAVKTFTAYPVVSALTNGAFTVTVPAKTGTLALLTDIPSPPFVPLVFTPRWEAYGDSITAGAGLTAAQTWVAVLSQSLGNQVTNNAVSGYFTHDNCTRVYNVRSLTSDQTAVMLIGTNDIRKQYEQYVTQSPDRILDQCLSCVLSAALYCALPVANKINVRTGTTLTGTWTNTGVYAIGMSTNVINSTMSATITGRYLVVAITGANTIGATYTGEKFNISITNFSTDTSIGGSATFSATNLSSGYDMVTGVTSSFGQRAFIYDTGIVGNHVVTVTYTGSPGTDRLYIDYMGGWNSGVGNNTLLLGVTNWNYRLDYLNDTAALYSSDTRRLAYNKGLLDICHMLRTTYFLPVYYVDTAANTAGGLQSDSLHPNYSGQSLIASRVLSVINKGEF